MNYILNQSIFNLITKLNKEKIEYEIYYPMIIIKLFPGIIVTFNKK